MRRHGIRIQDRREEGMIELKAQPDLVEIDPSGKLTRADYGRLVPELERLAAERGALRLYIELRDFRGWDPEGL